MTLWERMKAFWTRDEKAPARKHDDGAKMPRAMVKVAAREVGVEEVGSTNCGKRVNEYKAATWLEHTKAWPWCAAFVCWVVREAARETRTRFTATFERPRTAGAWDFENWCRKQDRSVILRKPSDNDIKAGDIVVFRFSHIGIAASNAVGGLVETIEGNTDSAGSREGGGVFRKNRMVRQIRSRIRFKV